MRSHLRYFILVGIFVAATSVAESALIFAMNYDAKLTVNDSVNHAQSRVKVRNGSTVPVEFQRYRVDITIAEASATEYRTSISIYEKSERKWYPVDAGSLSFIGSYGAPAVYEWSGGEISLDLAVVVSVASQ